MNDDKKVILAATAMGTVAMLMAMLEAWQPDFGLWYTALMTALAGLFYSAAVHLQRETAAPRLATSEARDGNTPSRDEMGADLKQMYETVSIALEGATDARDALLQFCAANGYRALQKGAQYFVQDVRTARVYRAEFPLPAT